MNYRGKGENLCPKFNDKRKNYLCVIVITTDVINATDSDAAAAISAVFADF